MKFLAPNIILQVEHQADGSLEDKERNHPGPSRRYLAAPFCDPIGWEHSHILSVIPEMQVLRKPCQ